MRNQSFLVPGGVAMITRLKLKGICRHPRQGLSLYDHCTNLVCFPPDSFMYCLTLFSNRVV